MTLKMEKSSESAGASVEIIRAVCFTSKHVAAEVELQG